MTVLVAPEFCGGVREPAFIDGTATAWGCYLLARVFGCRLHIFVSLCRGTKRPIS